MNTLQPKQTNTPRGAGISSLQDAARLLSLFLSVPIYAGSRCELSLSAFLSQAIFSETLQPCYRANYLETLLRAEEQRAIYVLEDPLGTRSVLILADEDAHRAIRPRGLSGEACSCPAVKTHSPGQRFDAAL